MVYFVARVDFDGPSPSALLFTEGQTVGDIQCAQITILDDFIPEGERNFSISIGPDAGTVSDGGDGGYGSDGGEEGGGGGRGGGGGVRVNPNVPSISINIDLDIDDRKFIMHIYASQKVIKVSDTFDIFPALKLIENSEI